MIRLPAAQRWPALLNAEPSVHVTAFCRSASSQTMSGFLPPSSRQVLASRRPAVLGDPAADLARAGEADDRDVGMLDERRAGFLAEAVQRRVDAVGHPASRASTPNAHADSGVSSAAFRIAALPQSSAGNAFQATLAIGVLAAMMRPATPSGCRTIIALLFGTALVVVWP